MAEPEEGVVYVLFGSDSQVTLPLESFRIYLYWKLVLGGSETVTVQTG